MVTLGPGLKPILMPSYPHMMAEDTAVWSKYLADPITPIKEVWYDVHVGGQVKGIDPSDIMGNKIAAGITRKRIDVVARVGGGFWVIEIKPFGSMLALGQALSYTKLFIDEYRPVGQVWPVVVCERADDDLIDEFEDLGVALITTE